MGHAHGRSCLGFALSVVTWLWLQGCATVDLGDTTASLTGCPRAGVTVLDSAVIPGTRLGSQRMWTARCAGRALLCTGGGCLPLPQAGPGGLSYEQEEQRQTLERALRKP